MNVTGKPLKMTLIMWSSSRNADLANTFWVGLHAVLTTLPTHIALLVNADLPD